MPDRVLRAIAQGHSFTITNNGTPVTRLVPVDAPRPELRIIHPARRVGGWSDLGITRKPIDRSFAEVMDELREERLW